MNPTKGYRRFSSGPVSGYTLGTKIYVQAASVDLLAPAFPLFVSNRQVGTFFF